MFSNNRRSRRLIGFWALLLLTMVVYGYYLYTLMAANQIAQLFGEFVKISIYCVTSFVWYLWFRSNQSRKQNSDAVQSQSLTAQKALYVFALINWLFIVFLSRIDLVIVFSIIGLVWFGVICASFWRRESQPANLLKLTIQFALITIALTTVRVFTLV
jgi:hypothetical protein